MGGGQHAPPFPSQHSPQPPSNGKPAIMSALRIFQIRFLALFAIVGMSSCATGPNSRQETVPTPYHVDLTQVPTWSSDDLEFFLHGSMGTEVLPERVLHAFMGAYPDLYPGKDLSSFGLIVERSDGVPMGFSRREIDHLGGLPAIGMNCAACHVGRVESSFPGTPVVTVLGMTSHFDVEQFFGALTLAMLRTQEPANMKRFLKHYLDACDPEGGAEAQALLDTKLGRQSKAIAAAIKADPSASKDIAVGALHPIRGADLQINRKLLNRSMDLVPLVKSILKLFHNMRAALHIPDKLPKRVIEPAGPGRNDAFGLLASSFFGLTTVDAPSKYGLAWDLTKRTWVHWDGNNNDVLARNLSAALGLGAPIAGDQAILDFELIKRHTALSQPIRPPRYPFPIDVEAARRGKRYFQASCASCHTGPEDDPRLFSPEKVGTDPNRARQLDQQQAELYHKTKCFSGI